MNEPGHSMHNLSGEQTLILTQFKDLTGFDNERCLDILRENNWDLEVSLNLAFDGIYNVNRNSPNRSPDQNIRHRHTANSSTYTDDIPTPEFSADNNENVTTPPNNEQQSLGLVLWNTTTWILKLPFLIAFNTFNTLYDFFVSMIRPTLNYDYNGTVDQFITIFNEKYGNVHPDFFRGTYLQALDRGKQDIRFVLIYIHSPFYRDIDRFCSSVIATQTFKDFINNENVIFWGCSVNYPDGYKAFQSLRPNSYPFFTLFGLKNNRMTPLRMIEGNYKLPDLIKAIKTSINNNEYSLISARLDRDERNMSNLIRAQQDAAFEESLKVDKEKERKRKEEEDKKANEERLKKEKEDEIKRREAKIVELKSTLLDKISYEPECNDSSSIRILFKLPNGTRLERRFFKHDPVKYLYYFVFCNEPSLINFKLRTNFPTRDIVGCSPTPDLDLDDDSDTNEGNTLIEKCDLGNNIVLFVHDLDS